MGISNWTCATWTWALHSQTTGPPTQPTTAVQVPLVTCLCPLSLHSNGCTAHTMRHMVGSPRTMCHKLGSFSRGGGGGGTLTKLFPQAILLWFSNYLAPTRSVTSSPEQRSSSTFLPHGLQFMREEVPASLGAWMPESPWPGAPHVSVQRSEQFHPIVT